MSYWLHVACEELDIVEAECAGVAEDVAFEVAVDMCAAFLGPFGSSKPQV